MLGEPRQAQCHEQNIEHEQFIAFALVNGFQPPAHQLLTTPQQQHHQSCGLEHGQGQGAPQIAFIDFAQCRNQYQQRHHRQVLEQQNAHHALTMGCFQFGPVGHHFDDDGGARHGKGCAQRQCPLPAQVPGYPHGLQQPPQQSVPSHSTEQGDHDLGHAKAKNQFSHPHQLG